MTENKPKKYFSVQLQKFLFFGVSVPILSVQGPHPDRGGPLSNRSAFDDDGGGGVENGEERRGPA